MNSIYCKMVFNVCIRHSVASHSAIWNKEVQVSTCTLHPKKKGDHPVGNE